MAPTDDALPEDVDALRTALIAARTLASQATRERDEATAELAVRAAASEDQAQIAHLKLRIAKLQRQLFGTRSERTRRLIDQLELQLEELETQASEDDLAAEITAAATATVAGHTRKRPSRQPLPAHLPRERVVEPAPCACPARGGGRLSKLGEDITETLEVIPRRWKVIQHVREKFSCRDCEAISQAPAPFHVTPRGWAGPNFLAKLLFERFGQHQPLNRQAERYARKGVPLSLSTLADQVGAGATALTPLFARIEAHVLTAERLHGDDVTLPVLAKGKTDTGRLWVYVRDDSPFAGPASPAAVFYYSRDRKAEHPKAHLDAWSGILQADAYAGFGDLYGPERRPAPALGVSCWAHGRRKVLERADVETAAKARGQASRPVYPLALEAVRRIDGLFATERELAGLPPAERLAARKARSAPLVAELEVWMRQTREKLSPGHDLAKALNYMLRRWPSFTRFLKDGRVCLSNNAAERALRGVALGRKAWLFRGSDRGGQRAAIFYSLIVTARMNSVDPQAWLAGVLARIAEHPVQNLDDLLPWNWRPTTRRDQAAA